MLHTPKVTLCENCGKELKGRSDKRFCDDSCRNTYNHRQRMPDNEVMSPVINILKKNRNILMTEFDKDHRTMTKSELMSLGFNFDYCTQRKTLSLSQYYFCFDYGYELLPNDQIEIISEQYFEFYYASYLGQKDDFRKPNPDDPDDVVFYEALIEPLRVNSELKKPPESRTPPDPTLRVVT